MQIALDSFLNRRTSSASCANSSRRIFTATVLLFFRSAAL